MRWEVLIIPLIALGVWIIGTLFKSEEEKTKKIASRRGNAPGRAPGRRVVTDLDRFLDEARRRREPEERRKAAPTPPSRVPPARPPLRERPTRAPETPRVAAPAIVKEEVVAVQPVSRSLAQPPTAQPAPTRSSSNLGEARAATQPSGDVSIPQAPVTRPSPIAQQVRSLLSKPQTAAAAFVLREIFDRPLCKRRR